MIDDKSYVLDDTKFIKKITPKTRIVIGNTFLTKMKHFIGWNNRYNGKYDKCAMYTIGLDGNIYQHFPPMYFSNFMDDLKINESTITVVLENEGWLMKDLNHKNKFVNYVYDIYNRDELVFEKKWRNHEYWAPYTIKQEKSLSVLINKLCDDFNIPKMVIEHNTSFDDATEFNGILYRSNFEKHYTDVSPAWNFDSFKKMVEQNN
jgi:hypothetical protein